jgi:hypothetical protein
MSELDDLMLAFGEAGGDRGALADERVAHLAASGHSIQAPWLLVSSGCEGDPQGYIGPRHCA